MRVAEHETLDELRRRARGERRAKVAQRLRVVILAREGGTAERVAAAVGLSRRQAQHWVGRYNAHGTAGLEDRPGRGPKRPLSPEQEQALCQRLDAGPRPEDGVCALRGRDVRRILAEEFGVARKLAAVYDLLHRLGYSCLMPRPAHRRGDPAAQEEFKKTCPPASRRFAGRTPAAGSKSSSRTSAASASRGR